MSDVLASEANVATRHELFSTYCFSKDRKCRDTTRHALKKKALTTDPSQEEALLIAQVSIGSLRVKHKSPASQVLTS